jgi:hypothetical protein
MANNENLKSLADRTTAEQREIAIMGGKASGEARRERKALKEQLLLILEDGDTQEKLCTALVSQARRGNIKAFEVLRDTIGEKPVDKSEVSGSVGLTDADRDLMNKIAKRIDPENE